MSFNRLWLHILQCVLVAIFLSQILTSGKSAEEGIDDAHGRRQLDVDTTGFISIDCGLDQDTTVDTFTGILYTSDAGYTDTEVSMDISQEYINDRALAQSYKNVRSFPNGSRNCYNITVEGKGINYLIRARFMYGNYDGKNSIPTFDVYIGVNFWLRVKLNSATDRLHPELMYNTTGASIFICLVNIGEGTPFISVLELRPLSNSIYIQPGPSEALNTLYRYDVGSNGENLNTSYLKDPYTRIWNMLDPSLLPHSDFFSNSNIGALTNDAYSIPPVVLSTAAKPMSGYRSLSFTWNQNDTVPRVQIYWHFAEIEKLGFNDSMEFNIFLGSNPLFGPIKLRYLDAQTFVSPTIYLNGSSLSFSINQTSSSALPPIFNALEIYSVIGLTKSPTNQEDGMNLLHLT
ncbi:hypothetical protein Ancab_012310 [Ancistrocladus abbreviatus]